MSQCNVSVNAFSPYTDGSLNWLLKCSVTRALSSAALHIPEYDRESVNIMVCVCGQITKSITLHIITTRYVVMSRRCPCHVVCVQPSAGMPYCR